MCYLHSNQLFWFDFAKRPIWKLVIPSNKRDTNYRLKHLKSVLFPVRLCLYKKYVKHGKVWLDSSLEKNELTLNASMNLKKQ